MEKKLRVMFIGAHPDDCDLCCGGVALKYVSEGHKVKFVSVANGCGGHHILSPEQTAERRRGETQQIAKMTGIEYDVWDITDCEISADLETRKHMVRQIRKFNPDIIFCNRPNDYHVDHRNASLLVQDASYLLIVPNFCPEVPAMKKMPVIMHWYDRFQNPPFQADVVVDIDEVLDRKIEMVACHESQLFEWLPFTKGTLDQVPKGKDTRIAWLHEPRLDGTGIGGGTISEQSEAVEADKFRSLLVARYGEKGNAVHFAEAYALCEYGTPLTKENEKLYFPF